ncbi:MAG TPA: hypothetical protein VIY28_15075 [Pseudonocardiaceae bacterium]
MISRTKMTLLVGAAVLTIAGVGTGIAVAQTSSQPSPTPPTPSSSAPAPNGMHHGRGGPHGPGGYQGALNRVEHGEATVRTDNGFQVIEVQRGTVASVSPTQLSVRSADGFTGNYVVDSSTKIRKDRKDSTIGQVAVNDQVTVMAIKTGDTATAKRIGDGAPGR